MRTLVAVMAVVVVVAVASACTPGGTGGTGGGSSATGAGGSLGTGGSTAAGGGSATGGSTGAGAGNPGTGGNTGAGGGHMGSGGGSQFPGPTGPAPAPTVTLVGQSVSYSVFKAVVPSDLNKTTYSNMTAFDKDGCRISFWPPVPATGDLDAQALQILTAQFPNCSSSMAPWMISNTFAASPVRAGSTSNSRVSCTTPHRTANALGSTYASSSQSWGTR